MIIGPCDFLGSQGALLINETMSNKMASIPQAQNAYQSDYNKQKTLDTGASIGINFVISLKMRILR